MLKVKPVSFTEEEQNLINNIYETGESGPDMWKESSLKAIRNKISRVTLTNQQCYCAFCEGRLEKGTTAIEHIVLKSRHREFTYEPENLVSACGRCNSKAVKGEKETLIEPLNPIYSLNRFKIVHPVLDEPDEHIVFKDKDRIFFDVNNCSQLGKDTIEFFKWEEINATEKRTMSAFIRKQPSDIVKLVEEISTYKL